MKEIIKTGEKKSSNLGLIYSNQMALFGKPDVTGYGGDSFKVVEICRDVANKVILKNHYSKKIYSGSTIHLGVFKNENLCGVLQYGYAMNPASQASVVAETEIDEYLELNRMWLSDELGRNSESMAIAYSIKYIKHRHKKIKWIQSFADERCGKYGIVYQASNFEYFGEHEATFWTLDGIIYHNSLMTRDPKLSKSAKFLQDNKEKATSEKLRQFRYIYFIDKKYKKNVKLKQKQFEKHYAQYIK